MPEPTLHALFTGRAADGRGPQEAGRTREVFFMLRQEYSEHPVRRDHPHEATMSVNDRHSRLSLANRTPCGHLLIDARDDNRGFAIHKRLDVGVC